MIYTVGHSTRTLDQLVDLLHDAGVRTLVDVRTIPRSRHNPQFNRGQLEADLPARGVAYVHLPALGGLRRPRRDSPNGAWHNESFRGFADYMQTPEFDAGLRELLALSERQGPLVIMCAEAVHWRCHRSLIADALVARGLAVMHLGEGAGAPVEHRLTPFAVVAGERVTYPRSNDDSSGRGD